MASCSNSSCHPHGTPQKVPPHAAPHSNLFRLPLSFPALLVLSPQTPTFCPQLAFPGYKSLNRIQSRIFKTAYTSNENILVCAPTGGCTRMG